MDHMLSRRWTSVCFAIATAVVLCNAVSGAESRPASIRAARADLVIAPTRVVFEGARRAAEVNLVNRGNATATYRLSFVRMRMADNGRLVTVDAPAPGERFADGMVRFSPREVRLEPGKSQVVRLQLRKPSGLEPGEYRSHLRFSVVPDETAEAGTAESGATSMSIQLTPVYGVSIPVIVRQGKPSASVTITEATLETAADQDPVLRFRLNRTGDRSVHGNVEVEWIAKGHPAAEVGRLKGMSVYVPDASRVVSMSLHTAGSVSLSDGRLEIRFVEDEDGYRIILATGTVEVPPSQ